MHGVRFKNKTNVIYCLKICPKVTIEKFDFHLRFGSEQLQNITFSKKSIPPPLGVSAPYLVIATALFQFERGLVVSIALMSRKILSSPILSRYKRPSERYAQQAFF